MISVFLPQGGKSDAICGTSQFTVLPVVAPLSPYISAGMIAVLKEMLDFLRQYDLICCRCSLSGRINCHCGCENGKSPRILSLRNLHIVRLLDVIPSFCMKASHLSISMRPCHDAIESIYRMYQVAIYDYIVNKVISS